MTRIQHRGGTLYFGEIDDISMFYNDVDGHLIIFDAGVTILHLGDGAEDVIEHLVGRGFQQMRTVYLHAQNELPIGSVVDVDPAMDDAVVTGGANSTATVGISLDDPQLAGSNGPICTVPGSIVDIFLTAAGVRGQYVATSAGGGTGTCFVGLPAAGRTIGMCLENTGGAGLARCVYMRM